MRAKTVSVSLVGILLAGCATNPHPQDFTGKSTYEIVQRIRCEARDAARAQLVEFLMGTGATPRTLKLAEDLMSDKLDPKELKTLSYDSQAAVNAANFLASAIAMDFTFTMTESNENKSDLKFTWPVAGATLGLGLSPDAKLDRQNTRNFTISDEFGLLITGLSDSYCGVDTAERNVLYPVVGNIGLVEQVRSFVRLNAIDALDSGEGEKVPALTDTVKFTTTITLTANPTITIKGASTGLASADLTSTNSRTDDHSVKIAISAPEKKVATIIVPMSAPAAMSTGERFARAAPVKRITKVVYVPGSAKSRAIQAIDRQYVLEGYALLRDIKSRIGR